MLLLLEAGTLDRDMPKLDSAVGIACLRANKRCVALFYSN